GRHRWVRVDQANHRCLNEPTVGALLGEIFFMGLPFGCHRAINRFAPYRQLYCLSRTCTLSIGWPCALTPFWVRVSVLPSFDTTSVTVPICLPLNQVVRCVVLASIRFSRTIWPATASRALELNG